MAAWAFLLATRPNAPRRNIDQKYCRSKDQNCELGSLLVTRLIVSSDEEENVDPSLYVGDNADKLIMEEAKYFPQKRRMF